MSTFPLSLSACLFRTFEDLIGPDQKVHWQPVELNSYVCTFCAAQSLAKPNGKSSLLLISKAYVVLEFGSQRGPAKKTEKTEQARAGETERDEPGCNQQK